MIWICSLFLLAIAAWFFFNALNERRWVEAHSHDETVASDEGLLSGLTMRTGTGPQSPDGKISIDQENSRFARAVQKVQEKTSGYGDKFFESKIAEARDQGAEKSLASEENTLFGRAVAVVSEKSAEMETKFKNKLGSGAEGQDANLFERATKQVAEKSDDISKRVASGAKNLAGSFGSDGRLAKGGALFSSAAGGLQKFEKKLGKRAKSGQSDKDIVSRVSEKVGSEMEQIEKQRTSSKPE